MYREGIKCPKCWDCLYSSFTHDFRRCFCGYCFVDGGKSYQRIGWGGKEWGNTSIFEQPPKIRINTDDYLRDEWPYDFKLQES